VTQPTLDTVWHVLEQVADPEIPVVNLRELGILRTIRAQVSGGIDVVLTPTYSGCPAMDAMVDDVKAALAAAHIPATVVIQLSPAWTTDWITPQAREKLRAYGIAPPSGLARHVQEPRDKSTHPASASHIIAFARRSSGADHDVPCPRCGSTDTTATAHFGSTACKALYRCLSCMEPFDYFKPY
jgi:ring-1,2-phenylacetyl-CoA epoxidase subunit PaaD